MAVVRPLQAVKSVKQAAVQSPVKAPKKTVSKSAASKDAAAKAVVKKTEVKGKKAGIRKTADKVGSKAAKKAAVAAKSVYRSPAKVTVQTSTAPAADAKALWTAYGAHLCDATRNALMEFYLPVVQFHADRMRARLPDGVDVGDLIGAGVFGLEKAIRAFEPERGFKFETFCAQRICGEILDSLRAMDWVPRLVRARTAKVDAAVRVYEMVHARKPTEAELGQLLGIGDADEFDRVRRDSSAASVASMHHRWSDADSGRDTCEADVLVDRSQASPLSQAVRADLKAALLKGLTRSEKLIVALYYWEQLTMKEIGQVLDLSESRVSQMHAAILGRLKAQLGSRADEWM